MFFKSGKKSALLFLMFFTPITFAGFLFLSAYLVSAADVNINATISITGLTCNQACTTSAQCSAVTNGICSGGFCRNSSCTTETDCSCPGGGPPPPPPPPPPTCPPTCPPVPGCTDLDAFNYDPAATVDDESCIPKIFGCTDSNATNQTPGANTDDDSCLYTIRGCIDPNASNPTPGATENDGSCLYLSGCMDLLADNYIANAVIPDNDSCIFSGCLDQEATNYWDRANRSNGSCIFDGCTDSDATNYWVKANHNDGSCIIYGCTIIGADNYDPKYTINDGSCIYRGCRDQTADNYEPLATIDDGSCIIPGCIDPTAVNYSIKATYDDNTCSYNEDLIPGCMDESATNYNRDATINNNSCEYLAPGCTDQKALNYNASAEVNNDSCFYQVPVIPPSGSNKPIYYFYTNHNGLSLYLGGVRGNTINLLVGRDLTIGISDRFRREVRAVSAVVSGRNILFNHNLASQGYVLTLAVFNQVGEYPIKLLISYADGYLETQDIIVDVLPFGKVFSKLPADKTRIFGISVLLYDDKGNIVYGLNKINDDGTYGFMASNGNYKLVVFDNGEKIYDGRIFTVGNNVINKNIGLSLWEQIIEAARELLKASQKFLTDTGLLFNEKVLNNPQVEGANKYAAPAIISIVFANAFLAIPWWDFASLLQLFFTEPLGWLFRRRKKNWGVVYNSITKKPVDLAVVRLYDQATGRLLKSRVTDKLGRYNFLITEGEYYLEVVKPNMIFPSQVLQAVDEDKQYVDLYHGGTIIIQTNQKGVITANIPMDTEGVQLTDRQILRGRLVYRIRKNINVIGPILSIGSFIIAPQILFGLFTVVHLSAYLLFRRLALQAEPNKWGIVLDAKTHQPVANSIAKIYSPEYDKMLEAQVTDRHGRYGFLAGNNVYFITAGKDGYETTRTNDIDLTHKKSEEVVGQDIKIKALINADNDADTTDADKNADVNADKNADIDAEKSASQSTSDLEEIAERIKKTAEVGAFPPRQEPVPRLMREGTEGGFAEVSSKFSTSQGDVGGVAEESESPKKEANAITKNTEVVLKDIKKEDKFG